jgi:hypothetical protein
MASPNRGDLDAVLLTTTPKPEARGSGELSHGTGTEEGTGHRDIGIAGEVLLGTTMHMRMEKSVDAICGSVFLLAKI